MLVVKYNVSEEKLKRNFEPGVHILCLVFGYGPAISGIFLDLYNAAGLWCWIAPLPQGCLDSARNDGETTCARGDNAWIYRWALFFGPLWLLIVLITVIMAYVYWFVRQKEKVSRGKLAAEEQRKNGAGGANRPRRSSLVTKKGPVPLGGRYTRPTLQQDMSMRVMGTKSKSMLHLLVPRQMADRMKSSTNLATTGVDSAEVDYVMDTIEQYTSSAKQIMDVNHFGSQAVFRQSLFYTLACYACFLFATVNRLTSQISGNSYFAIRWLHVVFIPLQGFFNVLIYRYGFYLRLKQRHPELSHWELLHHSWRWSFMGPPPGSVSNKPTTSKSMISETGSTNIQMSPSHKEGEKKIRPSSNHVVQEDGCGDEDQASSMDSWKQNVDNTGDVVGGVNMLDDELFDTPAPVETFVSDMMYSYSEFPNMAAENDMVVVSASFPTMVDQFPVSNVGDTPQAYPTFSNF
jgi:hypothetical protein